MALALAAGTTLNRQARTEAEAARASSRVADRVTVLAASCAPARSGRPALLTLKLKLSRSDGQPFSGSCGITLADARPRGLGRLSDFMDYRALGSQAVREAQIVVTQGLRLSPPGPLPLRVGGFRSVPAHRSSWWEHHVLRRPSTPARTLYFSLQGGDVTVPGVAVPVTRHSAGDGSPRHPDTMNSEA